MMIVDCAHVVSAVCACTFSPVSMRTRSFFFFVLFFPSIFQIVFWKTVEDGIDPPLKESGLRD